MVQYYFVPFIFVYIIILGKVDFNNNFLKYGQKYVEKLIFIIFFVKRKP